MTDPRFDIIHRNGNVYSRKARSTAVERDEHGLARYTSWGCRCPACKEARRVYDRAWRAERNALAGRVVRRRVPVERTAVALEQLRANGWSMRSIADLAGCSDATLHRVQRSARAGRGRVWSDIEQRITEMAGVVEPNGNGHPKSLLSSDLEPWSWRDAALCKGKDPEPWFPGPGNTSLGKVAKAVCSRCPVTAQCLDAALAQPVSEDFGVWAGTTPGQRARMRKLKSANFVAG